MGSLVVVLQPTPNMDHIRLLLLLILPLAIAYKYDKKVAALHEKLALQKEISNSIDHGPEHYKSSAKGINHHGTRRGGLLGHKGEHWGTWATKIHNKKLKLGHRGEHQQPLGHRGEHQQPANTRHDNDDINLQRLDSVQERGKNKRKPNTVKQMKKNKYQKHKLYKKLLKEKSKKKKKYQKDKKKY